jgi:hypothetical protein
MTKKKFSEIVKEMLIPSINKTAEAIGSSTSCEIGKELESFVCELKWDIYNEYQKRRDEFKVNFMLKGKKSRINRHKIAALFCVSFIYIMEENNFFDSKKSSLKYSFVHNAIFNAAIGIIEAFIYFDEDEKKRKHNQAYCSYVKKNGIFVQNEGYKPYNIKEFILAYKKKNEFSILLLASIFHSIECHSKMKFKESKNLKKKD